MYSPRTGGIVFKKQQVASCYAGPEHSLAVAQPQPCSPENREIRQENCVQTMKDFEQRPQQVS